MSRNDDLKIVVRLIREDTELMLAMMAEKVAIYGTLDYRFFHFYFEKLIERLRALEELL